jgi:hypothetical protein
MVGRQAIIAAVTPIPDDIVYISLGLARYSPCARLTTLLALPLDSNDCSAKGRRDNDFFFVIDSIG